MKVPRTKDNIRIPVSTDEALAAFLKVKPTANMPRPGPTNKATSKKKKSESKGKTTL